MEPFVKHQGRIAVLDWTDVNTDLIIPARYLKRIERTGFGPLLFADKRYEAGGAPEADAPERHGPLLADFPLNTEAARGATILVVGRNFGCGSSREHAVWAIAQAGFRALIAPGCNEGFADIFEGNAFNNGLLPIELPVEEWEAIARAGSGTEVTIDLEARTVTVQPADGEEFTCSFKVSDEQRQRLLKGLDAISETMGHDAAIRAYEQRAPHWASATSM